MRPRRPTVVGAGSTGLPGDGLAATCDAGLNVAVKLHLWEYAFKKHGTDTWGLGTTSDALWNACAGEEPDSTRAYRFRDLAIMRTSATCLEMPFWEKPLVLLPATTHLGFTKPLPPAGQPSQIPCQPVNSVFLPAKNR